jgi:hypothetical protein
VRRVRLSLFMAAIMLRKLAPRLRLSRYLCRADQRDELAPPHLLPPRLNTRHRTNTAPVVWKESVNIRFGSSADIKATQRHVRFTPESGHAVPCSIAVS